MPEAQQQGEQFKAKIELGVDKALPAEQIKNLKDNVKAETEKSNDLKSKIKDIIKSAFNAEKTADLAITAEEKQAVFKDVKDQLVKQLGGEEAAQKVMQKFGINTAEKLMQRIGLRSVEEQNLYEKFSTYLKTNPAYVLKMAKDIKDSPWGKKMMDEAVQKAPEATFTYAKEIKDAAEDFDYKMMLMEATGFKPEAAFKNLENFKEMPWANEVLKFAVEGMTNPEDALKYLPKIKDIPEIKAMLITVVENMQKPEDIFKYLKDIVKIEGASEILINAVLKAQNKEIAFNMIDQYKTIPNAASVLLMALPFISDKTKIIGESGKFSDIQNADTVIINALMLGADPEAAFINIADYKDQPNAKGVLILAASMDPKKAFEHYEALNNNLSKKDTQDIIKTAISVNPDLAFENIGLLKNISPEFLINALTEAIKNKPEDAFLKFDKYKDLPEASKTLILGTAAELDPAAAILNYKIYNNQKVLKIAGRNMRPMDLFNNEVWNKLETNLEEGEFKKELFKDLWEKHKECKKLAIDILKLETNDRQEATPETFFKDPALQKILEIDTDWIKKPVPKDTTINDARIIIARNLFEQKIEPSEASVKTEWKTILEHKEKYKDLPLFKGRNVVMFAENERNFDSNNKGFYNYGSEKLQENIRGQGAKVEFLRADVKTNTTDDGRFNQALKTKSEAMNKIVNTPPPFSFYSDGHSTENALLIDKTLEVSWNIEGKEKLLAKKKKENKNFKDPVLEKELETLKAKRQLIRISDKEFAELLRQRNINFNTEYKDMKTRPIIIITSCESSQFMRSVYTNLTKNHPLPITVATSEYSAQSFSAAKVRDNQAFTSEFQGTVLDLENASKDNPTTMGTIFKNENKTTENNPVVMIPSRKVGGRFVS